MFKFQIFRSTVSYQYYFRFLASNGKQLLSSEGYTTKDNCKNGIASVKLNAKYDSTYERLDSISNYRFNIRSIHNGQVIARSSEGYTNKADRDHAIELVKKNGPNAGIEDLA